MSKFPASSLGTRERCAQRNEDETDPQAASRSSCLSHAGNDLRRKNVQPRTCNSPHDESWLDCGNAAACDVPIDEPPEQYRNGGEYFYAVGHSRVVGVGVHLPEQRVTSREIFESFDSRTRFGIPYDWLERTMGIKECRMTHRDVFPSQMAISAAREALERAEVTPLQVDVIIYVGITRDYIEPATAHRVQHALGARKAIAFDVTNACHGFMNGIHLADALIALGQVRYALIVTGEQLSRGMRRAIETLKITDDRKIFNDLAGGLTLGDAGAAMILGRKLDPGTGFVGITMYSLGEHSNLCIYGTRGEESTPVITDMSSILKVHLRMHAEMYEESMRNLAWRPAQIQRFVHHQVSVRAFKIHSRYSKVPVALMPDTVSTLGNLATASIPVGLYRLALDQQIAEGTRVFIAGAGSGLSISQAGIIWGR